MSVLGSQLEIDLDPDGDMTVVPRHVGNTGTGCFKLHDHGIRDTKKPVWLNYTEKQEATYMYAPTPDEPEDPEEPDGPPDDEDDNDEPHLDENGGKNGALPKQASKTSSNNSRTPPQTRPSHPNSHTPHLLDAPVQQQPQPQLSTAPVLTTSSSVAPSQKSANASLGVSLDVLSVFLHKRSFFFLKIIIGTCHVTSRFDYS